MSDNLIRKASHRRPTICFVAPNAYPIIAGDEKTPLIGGAELQQVIVAKGLAERGYAVHMICLDFGQQEVAEISGVKIYRAYGPGEGLPVLRFLWPRLVKIWGCMKRANADIYYQRTAGMLTGLVAAFCKVHSRKSIFAAAGNPDLVVNTPRIRFARDRKIYEFGLRHVDRILTQNVDQRELCRSNFGRESTIVPNCYPEPHSQQVDKGRYILWVSTVRTLKRPEIFLSLAEMLPSIMFRMVGGPSGGEARLFDEIEARADKISNVEFLGFVPFSKTEAFFGDALLLVNTSESEGFPNTFLQAWSRGVPTLSFVDSGARLNGGRVGCQVASIDQMAEKIRVWVSDDAKRIGEGKVCLTYYGLNHRPQSVLSIYESIIYDLAAED